MISFPVLFDFVLRLTVILGVGLVMAAVLRRASAAERHLVLLAVVMASLLLPAGLLLVPRLSITVSGPPSVFQTAVVVLAGKPSSPAEATSPGTHERRVVPLPKGTDWLLFLAVAGTFAQAVRMVGGFLSLLRIQRESMLFAVPAPAALAARLIAGLGYLPPVRLAATVSIPFLCGWLRPRVILPAVALSWPEHRLVMVLAHEMAHIRRRDHLWQPVLLLFRLLYWWHPLARLALAQTLQERERACDDIVLSGDVRASDYARLLVETANASPLCSPLPALAMASASRITGRVRKILSDKQRRVPASRLMLGLISTVALVLFAAVTVTGLHAEEKPQAATSSAAKLPNIEIEFKTLQISEETYQQNREMFDSAIKASTSQAVQDLLRKLNNMKGVDLVSAPKVTTRSGQRSTIQIIREFRFPATYDETRTPTSFEMRDLGPTFEIEPSENNGKISLSGTFLYREFLGFIESGEKGPQTPTFQTREAHFFREQASGIPSLFLVPWQNSNSRLLSAIEQRENTIPSTTPTTQRLILFMEASFVEDPATVMKSNKALLRETILHDLDYRDAPLAKVIDDLFAKLSQQKTSFSFSKRFYDPVPRFTFKAEAVSAKDLLAEIEKQTNYTYQFDDLGLAFFRKEPPPTGKIPFGVPVPNKPGFAISPYAPKSGYVDLRGYQRGTEVKCPYTKKMFLTP